MKQMREYYDMNDGAKVGIEQEHKQPKDVKVQCNVNYH